MNVSPSVETYSLHSQYASPGPEITVRRRQ